MITLDTDEMLKVTLMTAEKIIEHQIYCSCFYDWP